MYSNISEESDGTVIIHPILDIRPSWLMLYSQLQLDTYSLRSWRRLMDIHLIYHNLRHLRSSTSNSVWMYERKPMWWCTLRRLKPTGWVTISTLRKIRTVSEALNYLLNRIMKKQTLKIKYPPLQKVILLWGNQWYIDSVTIYNSYFLYKVWDGWTMYMNIDESQIVGVVEARRAGFRVEI